MAKVIYVFFAGLRLLSSRLREAGEGPVVEQYRGRDTMRRQSTLNKVLRVGCNPHRKSSVKNDLIPDGWRALPVSSIFQGFTCIIFVRAIFEALLEEHSIAGGVGFYTAVIYYVHMYITWMCLFLVLVLLVSTLADLSLSNSLKLVLLFSPLITIVPFIDYFINGGSLIYDCGDLSDFIYNYVHLFDPTAAITMVTTGVRLEVFLATTGTFLVSWGFLKCSPPRALYFAFSIYTTIFLFGYLPAFLPGWVRLSVLGSFPVYVPVFLGAVTLILIKLWKENPLWGRVIAHLLYPSRLSFYVLLIVFGRLFTARSNGRYQDMFSGDELISLVYAVISVALLFMHAKIRNDLNDREIDRISEPQRPVILAAMTAESASALGGMFLAPSFAFGLLAGTYYFVLWLLIFALSALYSEPPMRLRRFYPVGHCVLSLIGTAVFMSGASLAGSATFIEFRRMPAMIGCVFASFFFLSHIKDFKDVDGDRHGGVMNVYNLTSIPRIIGMLAICGFTVSLIAALRILAVDGPATLTVVGVYLAVALFALARAREVRHLDWLIPFSFVIVFYASIVWLAEISG